MKTILSILLGFLLLSSCKNEKIQIISDYEQNIEGVKTDLKFKCKSIEQLNQIYGKDSLEIYKKDITALTSWPIDSLEIKINQYADISLNSGLSFLMFHRQIDSIGKIIDKIHVGRITLSDIDKLDRLLSTQERLLYMSSKALKEPSKFAGTNEINELNTVIKKYEAYLICQDSLLVTKYKCRYTIFNPFLQAKQEITKLYYISPKNKILKSE